MTRKVAVWIVMVVVLGSAAACSSCGSDKPAVPTVAFGDGPASYDELAQGYVAAIVNKDPEALRKTLLTEDDLGLLQKGQGKQYWQAYFMMSKQAFLEKNRPLLGQDLEIVKAILGRQIASREGVTVYRGSEIVVKSATGVEYRTEIGFVVEAGGKWKIFGVKYLSEGAPGRGVLADPSLFEGDAKFKGVDDVRDINLKVKKKPNPIPEEELPGQ